MSTLAEHVSAAEITHKANRMVSVMETTKSQLNWSGEQWCFSLLAELNRQRESVDVEDEETRMLSLIMISLIHEKIEITIKNENLKFFLASSGDEFVLIPLI